MKAKGEPSDMKIISLSFRLQKRVMEFQKLCHLEKLKESNKNGKGDLPCAMKLHLLSLV